MISTYPCPNHDTCTGSHQSLFGPLISDGNASIVLQSIRPYLYVCQRKFDKSNELETTHGTDIYLRCDGRLLMKIFFTSFHESAKFADRLGMELERLVQGKKSRLSQADKLAAPGSCEVHWQAVLRMGAHQFADSQMKERFEQRPEG